MSICNPRYSRWLLGLMIQLLGVVSCKEPTSPDVQQNVHAQTEPINTPMRANVLIITVDTTRADHLGCYGHTGIRTPNIDGLAKEGVLFENAFSVQPVTLPAHCSIFTGQYPYRHGVRDNNIYALGNENETLAEILSGEGYLTTAFVASYILNQRFGLNQGFQYYNDRFVKPKQKGRLPVDRRASEVSFLASEWLREVRSELDARPFFLWLHYYDPHADYKPPHPYNTAYANAYDGEIAYMDDWLGYFFDELKKAGKWDNTFVLLVGDHGEGLGEHDENTHGMFIYRATTHVPLIMKMPQSQFAGKRIASRVSQVDILPTVLGVLDNVAPSDIDGKSVLPLINGTEQGHRDTYSETFIPRSFHWSELHGLRSGAQFFVDAPLPEFYQTDVDKGETRNLYDASFQDVNALERRLRDMQHVSKTASTKAVVLTDEMTERLAQLGYFVATGGLPDKTDATLPDPKNRIAAFNAQQKANNLFDRGFLEAALKEYESLVTADPENPRLLLDLARLYGDLGEFRKAEDTYLKAAAIDTRNGRLYALLGRLYREWGRTPRAVAAFKKALKLNERDTISMFHLSLIAMAQKKYDVAEKYLLQVIRIQPIPAAFNNLGYIAIQGRKRFSEGMQYLKKAVKFANDKAPYIHSMGVAYLDAGQHDQAAVALRQAVALVPDNQEYLLSLIRALDAIGADKEVRHLNKRLKILRQRFSEIARD